MAKRGKERSVAIISSAGSCDTRERRRGERAGIGPSIPNPYLPFEFRIQNFELKRRVQLWQNET